MKWWFNKPPNSDVETSQQYGCGSEVLEEVNFISRFPQRQMIMVLCKAPFVSEFVNETNFTR
jgi:hypothetical protein